MFIYKTTNLINGKIYVGKSERNRQTYLGSGKILKQAIKKYGKENFSREILETCSDKIELAKREIYWIDKLDSRNNKIGYNIAEGGTGGDVISAHPNREEILKKKSKPCSVLGEEYYSHAEACQALGWSPGQLDRYLKTGLTPANNYSSLNKPCVVHGIEYPSKKAVYAALGWNKHKLKKYLKEKNYNNK